MLFGIDDMMLNNAKDFHKMAAPIKISGNFSTVCATIQ
jgi:hypothetical protein